MSKRIIGIILVGILSLAAVDCWAQCKVTAPVKLVKGQVVNNDHDKYWDLVTFGIEGSSSYEVSYVEILGENGKCCGIVYSPEVICSNQVTWYAVSLEEFKVPNDFFLKIHIIKKCDLPFDGISVSAANSGPGTSPIDPEETILIVKYP